MFVYPTWWSGLPAILKGWLERVMVPGVGFTFDSRTGKVKPGLTHVRRIVGISTLRVAETLRHARQRQRAPHHHPRPAHVVRHPAHAPRGSACTRSTPPTPRRQRHLEHIESRLAAL